MSNGSYHQLGRVISHWFYAITTGIPEDNITPLGLQPAMDLLIETLNGLTNPTSNFEQIREKTLLTALSDFGACSPEYKSIKNAWDRVCVDGTFEECVCETYEAPSLSSNTTAFNCLETSIDLNQFYNGITPSGASIVWSTDGNPEDGINPIISNSISDFGSYYAYFFNSAENCYSDASVEFIVEQPDLEIDENTYVTGSQYYSGNVIVKDGATLHLHLANIEFYQNRGIIVEDGGILILQGTTIDVCDPDYEWLGVKVESGALFDTDDSYLYNAKIGVDAKNNSTLQIYNLDIIGRNTSSGIGINMEGKVNADFIYYLDINQYLYGIKAINGNTMYEFNHGNISNTKYGLLSRLSPFVMYDYNVSSCDYGAYLIGSPGSSVLSTNISFNNIGVYGLISPNLVVKSCDISNAINADDNSAAISLLISGNSEIIYNTKIEGKRNAISVFYSPFSNIERNNIEVEGKENASGGPVSLTASDESMVNNNFIYSENSAFGIESNGNNNVDIFHNQVYLYSQNDLGASAIRCGGSTIETINANVIASLFNASGILANNSMGNHYICNDIYADGQGLGINYQSDQQEIRANILQGVDLDLLVRSEIGPQATLDPNTGNTIENFGNIFSGGNALAEGLTPDQLFNSRIPVNPEYPNHLPTNPIPLDDWFDPNNVTDFADCEGIFIGPTWVPLGGDPSKICNYWSRLKLTKNESPEKFFINVFHLLKYANVKQGFTLPNCILLDPDFQNLCGLAKMADINLALSEISKNDINTTALSSLQKDYGEQSDDEGRASIKVQMQNEMVTLLPQYESEAEADSVSLDSIDQEIDQINCEDIIITKWKEIWKLYIKYLKGTLDNNDKGELENHSSDCADLYGDAIHLARALVNSYSDTDYDVNDDCIDEGEPRLGKTKKNSDFFVAPNPTSGIVYLTLPPDFLGEINVTDINGRTILKSFVSNVGNYTIDLKNETAGLYFVKISSVDGLNKIFKIIMIK